MQFLQQIPTIGGSVIDPPRGVRLKDGKLRRIVQLMALYGCSGSSTREHRVPHHEFVGSRQGKIYGGPRQSTSWMLCLARVLVGDVDPD